MADEIMELSRLIRFSVSLDIISFDKLETGYTRDYI